MAIFGVLELEDTLQVDDKTRLSGVKSFVSKDNAAITLVEIEPHSGDGFKQVSGTGLTAKDWYLDWQYTTAGTKSVSIRITAGTTQTFTATLVVTSVADDKLWSSDKDLVGYEPDILKWVRPGRNSFLDMHRAAQRLILDWIYSQRIYNEQNEKLTKNDILVTDDVKQLSIYWTLYLIWKGMSNKPDDVFNQKAADYLKMVNLQKNSGRIQADFNGDGEISPTENTDMRSYRLVRR
jgi:hypothetical protein